MKFKLHLNFVTMRLLKQNEGMYLAFLE